MFIYEDKLSSKISTITLTEMIYVFNYHEAILKVCFLICHICLSSKMVFSLLTSFTIIFIFIVIIKPLHCCALWPSLSAFRSLSSWTNFEMDPLFNQRGVYCSRSPVLLEESSSYLLILSLFLLCHWTVQGLNPQLLCPKKSLSFCCKEGYWIE